MAVLIIIIFKVYLEIFYRIVIIFKKRKGKRKQNLKKRKKEFN